MNCERCSEDKPVSEFGIRADGRDVCIDCIREQKEIDRQQIEAWNREMGREEDNIRLQ